MITAQNFISGTLQTVDAVIGNFVQTGYTNLVQNNMTVITLMFVVYVAFFGYRALTHSISMDIYSVMRHLILMVIIYSLITDWNFFNLFFYNIFTNEPELIAQTMVNGGTASVQNALDSIFLQGMGVASQYLHNASFHNFGLYICATLVFLATALFCLSALGLFIYAKMAMAIMLFIAPLFFCFALWKPMRGFFERWVQALMNYALVPIMTTAILMLGEAITNTTLPGLLNGGTPPTFSGILPYVCISLINAFLLKQVLSKCAALSAGFALETVGSASSVAFTALSAAAGPAAFAAGFGTKLAHALTSTSDSSITSNGQKASQLQHQRNKF